MKNIKNFIREEKHQQFWNIRQNNRYIFAKKKNIFTFLIGRLFGSKNISNAKEQTKNINNDFIIISIEVITISSNRKNITISMESKWSNFWTISHTK